MKIHEVELHNVRHLRHVKLDLSAPITILGGPIGTGKTTVQQAMLTAMFHANKQLRDSLVSEYDRDSKPEAVLRFSRGEPRPTITLRRTLCDDQGSWTENGKTQKGKGKALEQIQESLPISADAAALLLWGLQEQMSLVLSEFPQDGKKLLTAATIRGAGPDPEHVIESLRKEFNDAKKGERGTAKNPGSLTLAQQAVERLQGELVVVTAAQEHLEKLEQEFGHAKASRDQLHQQRRRLEQSVDDTEQLLKLLDAAVKARIQHDQLEQRAEKSRTLDEQIRSLEQNREAAADELRVLESQIRFVKDEQLGADIAKLTAQIAAAVQFVQRVEEITGQIRSSARPSPNEMQALAELQKKIDTATDRMEASGFYYRVSAADGLQHVEIVEDQQPARSVDITTTSAVEGRAGRVLCRYGGLEISVSGKEDVAGHKRRIESTQQEIRDLLTRFAATDRAALAVLANEQIQLKQELAKAQQELERHLAGENLDAFRIRLAQREQARVDNQVTEADRAACGRRHLASYSELEKKAIAKDTERDGYQGQIDKLLKQRPTAEDLQQLSAALIAARAGAANTHLAFQTADPHRRNPSVEVGDDLRQQLNVHRSEVRRLTDAYSTAETRFAQLAAELKHVGPERPSLTVESELTEAQDLLRHEKTLQDARLLLMERIGTKMEELAAAVPEDLARRVSANLAKISGGVYARATLNPQLQIETVCREGDATEQWRPDQLSTGERTMAALTLKIAVAQALAESNPLFIILDDSMVNLDDDHRASTQRLLLDLAANGMLQVILLTCHSDWARSWHAQAEDRIRYIHLDQVADYYRTPATVDVG
ncbi:MAG: hypothetical protein K8T25_00335 [Planctomycetia bacterium]|nr:hypothetical protein [Planctomycetia bacterium]